MNPFAKALQRASHILVIPNSKISIYSRLWCVYEAYLGTTMEKICLMPATPQLRQQGTSCAKIILTPLLLGIITSLVWQHVIHVDDTTFVFQIMLTCLGLSLLGSLWGIFPPQLTTCTTVARHVHIVVIFMGTAVVLPWWSHAYDAAGHSDFVRAMGFFPYKVTIEHCKSVLSNPRFPKAVNDVKIRKKILMYRWCSIQFIP